MSLDARVKELMEFCGPERFNQFLSALRNECERKKRLMFWQEEFLAGFQSKRGVKFPERFAELLALFAAVSPMPLGITREHFLADPSRLWRKAPDEVKPEWIAEAWANPSFRDDLSTLLATSVMRVGSLHLASDVVETLAGALDADQVVRLYEFIRDESSRLEDEWRDEFEEAFEEQVPQLPPIRY